MLSLPYTWLHSVYNNITHPTSLAVPPQEVQRQRERDVEFQLLEHLYLHSEDLTLGVSLVSDQGQVPNISAVHLLKLAGNEHCSYPNQLQHLSGSGLLNLG